MKLSENEEESLRKVVENSIETFEDKWRQLAEEGDLPVPKGIDLEILKGMEEREIISIEKKEIGTGAKGFKKNKFRKFNKEEHFLRFRESFLQEIEDRFDL